jgi:hypothetical protein
MTHKLQIGVRLRLAVGSKRRAEKSISKTADRQIRPDMNYISLQNFSEANRFCLRLFEQKPHQISLKRMA